MASGVTTGLSDPIEQRVLPAGDRERLAAGAGGREAPLRAGGDGAGAQLL